MDLPGWERRGNRWTCPRLRATIEVREGQRPLRSLAAIVELFLATLPAARRALLTVADEVRFVTAEGERAATVTIRGGDLDWIVGVVLGDDDYVLFEGVARGSPGLRKAVDALMVGHRLGLGLRRRRFEHQPPAGWLAERRPGAIVFRRDDAKITLLDAYPLPIAHDQDWRFFEAIDADRGRPPLPIATPRGLAGWLWKVTGRRDGVELAQARTILLDTTFAYVARLETRAGALAGHLRDFAALLASIEPVPRGQAAHAPDQYDHYAV